MAKLILNGATSGSISLESPAVSGTTTLTLPATSGTVITTGSTFAGTGPAFSAYQSTLQAVANATFTKVQFQTEEFDTNSNFDPTTNYRFTPTVAGYYQVNASVQNSGSIAGQSTVLIYKNGSAFKNGTSSPQNTAYLGVIVSALVYFNGSSDYVEIYFWQNSGGSVNTATGAPYTYFQASMVRSA